MVAPMSGGNNKNNSYNPNDVNQFADFAERVDWITQCHSPAEIFSFFSKDEEDDDDRGNYHSDDYEDEQEEHITPYPLPSSCEYCGSNSIKDCSPSNCHRPSSFFLKQRPPFFGRGEGWDPKTDEVRSNQTFKTPAPLELEDDRMNAKKKDWMTKIGWRG